MKASPAFQSFNAGELSPTLEGRTDIAKYQSGCHLLEGFITLVQGPAQRRGGSRFVAAADSSLKSSWIRRFEFSSTQAFVLEFRSSRIRFFTQHGQLLVAGVAAWSNAVNYVVGDLVVEVGVNYYCKLDHINQVPPNATFWHPMPAGDIYEIPSPYGLSQLRGDLGQLLLQFEQAGDVLYIACRTQITRTLTRFADTRWIIQPYQHTSGAAVASSINNGVGNGPFLDQNFDPDRVVWASAFIGSVTVRANKALFVSTDVGRLIRIQAQNFNVTPWLAAEVIAAGAFRRFDGVTYKALNAATTGESPPIHTSGSERDGPTGVFWEFQDPGYGIATITAFGSSLNVTALVITQLPAEVIDAGVARVITNITQANPAVVTSNAHGFNNNDLIYINDVVGMIEVNRRWYRAAGVAANTFQLAGVDSTGYGAYTSGGVAIRNATQRWSLGAWSDTTEFPRSVRLFRSRLWWAGKLRLWASVPDSFADHAPDFFGLVTPDSAISSIVAADEVNDINWLAAAERLIIGTPGGEFAAGEITTVDPLGPGNFKIVRQSKRRCREVPPLTIGTAIAYMQLAGRRMLLLDYAFEVESYRSVDLNALAPHITKSGVIDIAFQQEPNPTIWCVLDNGNLIALTIDREQEVVAWHRHPIGGTGRADSVVCIPAPDGSRDEVWIIVRRTHPISGAVIRYVEFIEAPWEIGDQPNDMFYVDSGLTYSGAATTTITGLDHLEGFTVQILADGASHPDRVVAGGSITLDRLASKAQVGLQASARLVTMRPEAGSQDGTSQGKTKRTHGVTLRLLDTIGCKVGLFGKALRDVLFRTPSMPMDQAPPPFTGDKDETFDGDYETANRTEVRQDQPFPITVVGLFPRMRTYDR